MHRTSVARVAAATIGFVLLTGCAGPRAAPNLPVKGDRKYHGYVVVEARLRALNDRDLDGLDRVYSVDAAVLDAGTKVAKAEGLPAIKALYAQLLATCGDLTFDVVARKYSSRGRIVEDRERARCGVITIYERWFKYEIDVDRSRIVRVWEERDDG